jgi:hypothetical protein
MKCRVLCTMICALAFAASTSEAATFNILTNQGTGQDGLAYAGIPNAAFSTVFNVIAVGNTTGGVHNTVSLTQFEIPALESPQIISAQLKVFSASAKAFNANNLDPDENNQIPVEVSQITGAWARASLNWNNKPTHGTPSPTTFSVDGLGEFYTVDVTGLLNTFLDNSNDTNFGLWLEAIGVLGTDPFYAVAFNSGFAVGGGTNANGPELIITTVPEPASVLLALVAAPALLWAGVRRARSRRRAS